MIKKLRCKFVIINMSLVAVILCVVLGMFCFTRVHAFRAESEIAMRQMLNSSRSKEPPKNDTKPQSPSLDFGPGGRNPAFNSTPVFLVTLDENNEITDTNSSGSYTVTDTLSEAAVSAAFAVSEDQGYLSNLKLRFIKQNTPEGTKIAFADTVQETRALGELVIQCVMMLLLFLLCFLLVSIFLARWALKPVEKAWEQQNQFIADASHELKTPLTSMKVLADSLVGQQGIPEELYQEFMGDITAEIDRENKIITDLLSLVKMDKKAADVNITHMDINQLLEDILKRLRPIADKRNIDLILDCFRPVEADVDEVKFTLAISNLVENGIKYNVDDGWVRVSLDADHKYFYVTVADSGMGIPEDSIEKIFERFYRVDKSHSKEIGGTGLGLAITRSSIAMHHGAIKVFSKEGEGTTFSVRIPLSYIPA